MGLNRDYLSSQLASKIIQSGEHRGDFWITVSADHFLSVVDFLRNDPQLRFDSFVDLCGVDYLNRKPRFEVVTHLYSSEFKSRIRIRCQVPDETLAVPSLTGRWKGANWQEREAYDNYGMVFTGHPKLERILNAPDMKVFPQRKDYPLKGERDTQEEM